ncbi:flagellar motor protein MotB [Sediminispirochaeta smaragdinae]|jgi:chemotaxis protein MotB|uniref:OmpA/MotB domain protein n=1 Tax=Sediminispirochaeta smaragdinae (strain DSM 11293 / JCM 15392 / SEBR 4228) TaxID=573413 RepID=E1R5T5_SEDSS|nr:flagellar motor protein MotB [Sediminispirochaeta smaragdinae]ADK80700.1 OmpA/MotB domain protein [Sediminispirochaeta smaragdinae DSM 11293]
MADGPKKKKKKCPTGSPAWMNTYGDMVTLLLTFFVMLYTTSTPDDSKMNLILAAFSGLGMYTGGQTLQEGKLAELGNMIMSLPSTNRGRALDEARRKAISQFEPEIKSQKVRVQQDERGLIITLASDAFFKPASAEVQIEESRETLQKLSALLRSMPGRKFRIEGHTDSTPTDPTGPWPTNWELSTDRATNVLHYLVDFGVTENQFQVAGFADTVPLASESTEEGKAYNRRVDIIILSDGHL